VRSTPASLPSPPSECGICGRAFEEGERMHNILVEREGGGWERKSFCAACAARGKGGGYLCRWTSEYAPRPKPRPLPAELAADLLGNLLGRPEWAGAANLFAWHLVRRRTLKHLSTFKREGADYNLFEAKGTGRRFEVPFAEPGEEDRRRFFELLEMLEESER